MARLTNNFLFKDRCALPDQMSFVLTFPWRAFVFAMRNRDCTNLDEIAIFVFSVTTQHFPHDMLLTDLRAKLRYLAIGRYSCGPRRAHSRKTLRRERVALCSQR